MNENYEHYISRSIRSVYARRMIAPFLYIVLLVVLWLVFPFSAVLFPEKLTGTAALEQHFEDGNTHIQADLSELYFTGYTSTRFGRTDGYYYYTLIDNNCMFVLLSPSTSEEGLPFVEKVQINARIKKQGTGYEHLLDSLSKDLNWTPEGMGGKVCPYVISEPAFRSGFSLFLMVVYFATGAYSLTMIAVFLIYMIFPVLSPPCRRLGRYGKPGLLLTQAEDELATLPQLATEDMFITEHFFIEIAGSGIAIVPIQEILWIYKYSTLHKMFWYHFNISYTLHITAGKHLYIHCPKNIKSDIDGIIDYLSEANHDILVGFSEENRLKVQEIQNASGIFEKLVGFVNRRI